MPHETRDEMFKNAVAASFSGRGKGFVGMGVLGTFIGGALGAVAPFFPVLAGAQSMSGALALVPHSMAVFAAFGMAAGGTAGAVVGTEAGATAHLREKSGAIAKEDEAPGTRTRWQRFKDTLQTYINPKVGAAVGLLFAAAGAVVGAAYLALEGTAEPLPAMDLLLGKAAKNPAGVISYCAGVMGSFGGLLWSTNFPKIAAHAHDLASKLVTGKALGTQWGPPEKEKDIAPPAPAISIAQSPAPQAPCPSTPENTLVAHSVVQQAHYLTLTQR